MATPNYIHGYKVVREITGGGMSRVYHVEIADNSGGFSLSTECVLKTVRPGASMEFKLRLINEGAALERLQGHPNVIDLIKISTGSEPYLILELVEGETLGKLLARGPLEYKRFQKIAEQVTETVDYAHDRGVVHCDLKPGNIMLVKNRADLVKVLDLGIGQVDGEVRLTMTNEMLGTVGYMPPEQGRHSDHRVDIFALGVVFWEMLAGRPMILPGTGLAEAVVIQTGRTYPNLAELRPDVPKHIAELIYDMTEVEPAGRPQKLSDVLRVLRHDQAPSRSAVMMAVVNPANLAALTAAPTAVQTRHTNAPTALLPKGKSWWKKLISK